MADARLERSGRARRARIGSPANLLGLVRIIAAPIVIGLILTGLPGHGILAAVIFCVAGLTDFLDGRVARARGEVSPLGVFVDLTADKVLVAGVLVATVEADLLPTWMAATIVVRELVVAGVRQVAASEDVVIAARSLGKAKTLATLLGIAVVLLAHDARTGGPLAPLGADPLWLAGFAIMVVATLLTVVSGALYVLGAWPILVGGAPRRER